VGVVTAALAVAAMLAAWGHTPSTSALLPRAWLAPALAGTVVLAYRFPIHAGHKTKINLCTVVYYLLAVLVPPPLAAVSAGLGSLAGEVSQRVQSGSYPSDIATEAGRRALIVLVAARFAQAGGVPPIAGLLGAALILAMLDVLSVPLVLAPMSGDRPLRVMVAAAKDTAAAEGAQYAVAVLGAAAAQQYLWTLALLVVPCALVYVAFKGLMELQQSTRQLLENMADAVDLRDAYTGGHSRRVTKYCARILRELDLHGPEVDLVLAAARVHDIGKIGIPDEVLHKPGPLTDEERATMEAHPVHGAVLLQRHRGFARGVAIVRHHHERWDGDGYPDRISGMDIPFGARVVAVADSFDAMTSDRPYRSGMTSHRAAEILRAGRGSQWDAAIVDAFLRSIEDSLLAEASPARTTAAAVAASA
jgi:HD-GYP domain-containing protein (c-di-GMP phosphodiesterase class II)